MSDKVELSSFPSDLKDALAMLYLKNQDLSGKSPSEIHTMYWETRKEIQRDYQEKRKSGYEFRAR